MGYTEKISDYEMGRAATHVPAPEGVDIEASRAKGNVPKEHMSESEIPSSVTTSKVVEPEKKTPAKKSTARTKTKSSRARRTKSK